MAGIADLTELTRYCRAEEWVSRRRPAEHYRAGRMQNLQSEPIDQRDNGQAQFHRSQHIYRIAAPGNGWGKTAMAAVEVDWWGFGDHQHQDIPKRRRTLVWVCQKFQQFEIQKPMIERWWPDSIRNSWHGQDKAYTWPDGTRMFVITAETDWKTIQGIEPDLITIDEECEAPLWRELQRRRRGAVKTRYVITATATNGLTWTYTDLYIPWRKFHGDCSPRSEAETLAMREQRHRFDDPALADTPGIWCWPRGSHADNPTATVESWALYQQMTSGSPVEREVRLFGGFRQFSGSPVFDLEAVEKQRANIQVGETGQVVEVKDEKGRIGYDLITSGPIPGGHITVFERPRRDTYYSMGLDFAYGLEGKDFDAGVIVDGQGRQVLAVDGHWGERFIDVLWPILRWYKPFVVGERQVGLPTLRRLWDGGYVWMYFHKDGANRYEPSRDTLGHHASKGDLIIPRLQSAIRQGDVTIRDEPLRHECALFQFSPRSSTRAMEDARDVDLRWGAPTGEHDDRLMALAYAVQGLAWLPEFPMAEMKFKPQTFGHEFGTPATMAKEAKKEKAFSYGKSE